MREIVAVGILVNDFTVPQWVFSSIWNLAGSGKAEITLFISKPPAKEPASRKRYLLSKFILRLFDLTDYLIFYRKHNYNRKRHISEIKNLAGIVDLRREQPDTGKENASLTRALTGLKPEVIVKFGDHILEDQIFEMPVYGVWGFSIDSGDIPGGLDYGFWEVVRYRTASYSAIERLRKDPALNETIYGSWESTCPFSVNTNRNKLFSRAAIFLPRLVAGISTFGSTYLSKQIKRAAKPGQVNSEPVQTLEFPAVIRDMCKCLLRISGLVFNKLIFTDAFSWQLLIDINKNGATGISNDFSRFRKIESPSGVFWADPFVVADEEHFYVFVEEFIYRKNKAHISLLEINGNGSLLSHRRVIEKPYHMSYPFIFKWNGSFYMIPETAGNKSIELFRCTDFPGTWQFEKSIMTEVSATDTTLFQYNGRWWLFTTLDQTGTVSGGSTELFLFYSDDPLSDDWISHPLNPVVSDERTARCAGNLFIHDGELYRPSQDCSMRYGRGLNINRVTLINEQEYNEVVVEEIKPYWDKKLKGVHTINFDKNFTIIDTYKFHRRFSG